LGVGPWSPVMAVEMGPSEAGGDSALAELDEWTPEAIRNRQDRMAEAAVKIWQIDAKDE
jgi:hypothetical protein